MIYSPEEITDREGVSCVFRSLKQEDAEELIKFVQQGAQESPFFPWASGETRLTADNAEEYILDFESDPRILLLGAFRDGRLIGLNELSDMGEWGESMRHRCLLGAGLLKEAQGKGLGKKLMLTSISTAKEIGFEQVECISATDNTASCGNLRSIGFQEYGMIPHKRKNKDGSYTLKLGKTTLKEDEDYEVTDIRYNVEPGKGVIEFRAVEGNAAGYAGIKTQTFTISKGRDIADKDIECTLSGNMPVRYAKGGAKPPVKVVDRDKTLREGKDYTLSYSKNTSVGNAAVVTVNGKGRYKGSKPVNFEVVKQDIETLSGNIVVEDVVESKKGFQNPKVTITNLDGKKLSKKDYSLGSDYTGPDEEGTVTVTLKGEGNYEGKMTVSYRYIKADIHLKKAKAGKLKNQIYSGKPIRLEEEDLKGVLNLNKALVPDEDFEVVTYNKNVKPGTAKVTLRGIGAFGGVRVLPFKIAPKQGDYRGAYIDGEWKTGS